MTHGTANSRDQGLILKGVHGEGTDKLEHSHRDVCRMVGQNKE